MSKTPRTLNDASSKKNHGLDVDPDLISEKAAVLVDRREHNAINAVRRQ
jgi:hypothetical protein